MIPQSIAPNIQRLWLRALRLLGHQDWIRYGIRDRLLRRFCDPDAVGSIEFAIDFFGYQYPGNLNGFLDWCVYFYGAFEKQELFLLRDFASQHANPIFIDIGANVGQHTLFMARYCKRVDAFEPYGVVRQQLEHKLALNRCTNVVVHGVGLGAVDDELDYFAPLGANRGTGSFLRSHAPENNTPAGRLKIVDGDAYLLRLELDRIDLIKIDVEGFEKHVLSGLSRILHRYRPAVLMEFSDTTKASFGGAQDLVDMLPPDYIVKTVLSNRPAALFFNRPGYVLSDFDFSGPEANLILLPDRPAGLH